jgi:aryl-alcohol dehydrogenase-like predicted oxidoreductase
VKTAWDHGVNMLDTAECYDNGQSELEMCVAPLFPRRLARLMYARPRSGRVIRELGIPRSELVVTTKIFFGTSTGPNDTGLSRKQCVRVRGGAPAAPG